jgi:hypothetical protein
MASTTGWVSGRGQGLTWGSAGFTAANFNSLANGSSVSSTAINNSTNLDLYADVSFSMACGGTTTAASFIAVYLLPLNQDGTTYGANTIAANGTSTAAIPATYQVGALNVAVGATGTVMAGTFRGIVLPPGSFILALTNNLGVAMNASAAATVQYRTYNENLT